jgi:regulator of replication initiation timing
MTRYELFSLVLGFLFGFLFSRERNEAKDKLINRLADSCSEKEKAIAYYKGLVKEIVEENAALRIELDSLNTKTTYTLTTDQSAPATWSTTTTKRTRKKK